MKLGPIRPDSRRLLTSTNPLFLTMPQRGRFCYSHFTVEANKGTEKTVCEGHRGIQERVQAQTHGSGLFGCVYFTPNRQCSLNSQGHSTLWPCSPPPISQKSLLGLTK